MIPAEFELVLACLERLCPNFLAFLETRQPLEVSKPTILLKSECYNEEYHTLSRTSGSLSSTM